MNHPVFTINDRYRVNKTTGEIYDMQRKAGSKLEPRLTKLLCLLADHNGEVVNRDYLVTQIWNDYPGGSEGLNQAISFLRKLLNDESKELIRTIPKTGYSFHAAISTQGESINKRAKLAWKTVALLTAVFSVIFFSILYFTRPPAPANAVEKMDQNRAAELSRLDSAAQAERMKNNKQK